MIRLLLRIVIMAAVFYFILPLIHGIAFHGTFLAALGAGILFGVLSWIFELLAIAFSAMFAISTLGLGLLVLIPLWIIGYWLFPAFVLKVLADFMPHYLTVAGWGPAILGGLVLLVVGIVTSNFEHFQRNRLAPV